MLKNEFNTGNPVWVPLGGWQRNVFQKQIYLAEPTPGFEPCWQTLIALTFFFFFLVNVVATVFLLPFLYWLSSFWIPLLIGTVAQLRNCPFTFQIVDSYEIRTMSLENFELAFSFLYSCQGAIVGFINWGIWRKHMEKAEVLLKRCWSTLHASYTGLKTTTQKAFKGTTWMIWTLLETWILLLFPQAFTFRGRALISRSLWSSSTEYGETTS